ncbi:MAG: glycolate oxidase subunit GlcE [Geminicoccaceae bacterium]
MAVLRPDDDQEMQAVVEQACADGRALDVIGAGTKRALGRPVKTDDRLDLSAISGVLDYEPAELVLTARPGTPLADVEILLAEAGQALAFEPPDLSELFGAEHAGTLGGMIAANLSGPRRIKAGAARDHLLGFHGITGHGRAFKSGGRVVKNVTGYDLSKLVTGSMGTLTVLSELSIKTLPRPETTWTLILRDLDDRAAVAAMAKAMGSAHEVSGAAHLPRGLPAGLGFGSGALTALRLEGPPPSVEARFASLQADLGGGDKLEDKGSLTLWKGLRDVAPLTGAADRAIWRLSLPPAAGPSVVEAIGERLEVTCYYDWAGGLVWLAAPEDGDAGVSIIRGAIETVPEAGSGHATLIRAAEATREKTPVYQPQATALAALTRRVKESFDPKHVLNPGRMYEGV